MNKALFVLVLVFADSALAIPFIYTFSGHVVEPVIDGLMPVEVGDPAEYRFLVDRDLPGYQTKDGVIIYGAGQYYADYLGGGPYVTLYVDGQQSWNYMDDGPETGHYQIVGSLDGFNIYSFIQVSSYEGWAVGNTYNGHMQGRGVNNDYRDIYSVLTLTDISPVATVPEPSSLALLAMGALGMIVLKRRKRIHSAKA